MSGVSEPQRVLYDMLRVAKGFTCGGRTPARTLTVWRTMLHTLTRRWGTNANKL